MGCSRFMLPCPPPSAALEGVVNDGGRGVANTVDIPVLGGVPVAEVEEDWEELPTAALQ